MAYTSIQASMYKVKYPASVEVQLGALSTSVSPTGTNSPQILSPSDIQTKIELFHWVLVENVANAKPHSFSGVSIDEIGTTSDVSAQAMSPFPAKAAPNVIAMDSSNTPISEAYLSLRLSVQFMSLDRSMRTIQVTSSRTLEGKSTTVANLGVALAKSGQNVILVCCDLRLPRLHEVFELSNEVGFTSVILGETPLADALEQVATSRGSLRILASGPRPPNPSELLAGQKTAEILTELQVLADVVIIDCPPVLPVTGSTVLSKRGNVTHLNYVADVIKGRELDKAFEILIQADSPFVGTVVNSASKAEWYGGYYGYTYGHGYHYSAAKPSNKSTKKAGGFQPLNLRRRPLARTM
ncbi:MAG: CpsD/CapB family tyrosine-protein kinase [Acidimicrobiales bacterium]|nr:CpsD/CapB family tyrosine-protein kinase [Acidimicrobiales bacterium]